MVPNCTAAANYDSGDIASDRTNDAVPNATECSADLFLNSDMPMSRTHNVHY